MPGESARSHHSGMQESCTGYRTNGRATLAHVNIVVWSPFDQLASELRRLIDSSGDARSVQLIRQAALPQAIRDSGAQLAVLDVDSAPGGRAPFIADVHRVAPDVLILALSAKSDARLAASTLRSGASGYVLKDRAFEELLEAVRALANGAQYFSSALDRQGVERHETAEQSRPGLPQARRDGSVGHCEPDIRVRPDSSTDAPGA